MSDVTQLIQAIKEKQAGAIEQLFTLVYDELRRIASQRLASEKPGQSLQATALVHEAFVRLVDGSQPPTWNSRGHFFAAAVEAMRRILIEEARKRNSQKRGGGLRRVGLDEAATLLCNDEQPDIDILALDEALASLETIAPEHTRLVKLRYFAGLSIEDAAEVLGISVATAKRQWQFARSWLYGKLQGSIPANDAHTDD